MQFLARGALRRNCPMHGCRGQAPLSSQGTWKGSRRVSIQCTSRQKRDRMANYQINNLLYRVVDINKVVLQAEAPDQMGGDGLNSVALCGVVPGGVEMDTRLSGDVDGLL